MLTVDVHSHFTPLEVVEDSRRGAGFDGLTVEVIDGSEWMVARQGHRHLLQPAFYDLEARLESMDAAGTDRAVLSISPQMFMYWTDAAEAVQFCQRANNALAGFAGDSGGRIEAVATLPMQDPDAAIAELRRAVLEFGLRGAEIGPVVEGVWLDDTDYRKVLAAAEELGVPLILHPYYVGLRPGLEDFYLTNFIGNPLESTISAARLILGGVLDDLPELRLVLMHGGGFLPYQVGRLDHGHRVRPEAKGCLHPPSTYLDRFFFDTITHAREPLRFLIDMVGAGHVVFGTDFPFDMAGGSMSSQLNGLDLTEDQRAMIAGKNASRLFKLA